jgi:hypothetical protein|uniref:Uncharacterized protein n=1 Tax=Zea mays TaxID=4577 RepID=C0P2G7_MAIZE|nr:unknown [Zea mays]
MLICIKNKHNAIVHVMIRMITHFRDLYAMLTLLQNHELKQNVLYNIVTDLMFVRAGDGEDCARRINGPRPEADQQLVHQPEETALEAIGGHAFRDDGRLPPAERRCSVHGRAVHGRRHVSPRFMNYTLPWTTVGAYPIVGPWEYISVLRCKDIVVEFLLLIAKGWVGRCSVYAWLVVLL